MKTDAMKKKSVIELEKHTKELREKILESQKKQALAELNDSTEIRKLRKELARTLTFMTEKQMEVQNG